jgi:hypothetical protein
VWQASGEIGRVEVYYTPAAAPCYANCDQSIVPPVLNVDDFTCFINAYGQAQTLPHAQQVTHHANCDGSVIAPVLNADDFTCFINLSTERDARRGSAAPQRSSATCRAVFRSGHSRVRLPQIREFFSAGSEL